MGTVTRMNRWHAISTLLAGAAACQAPPSELPADTALSFGVSHMGTFVGFTVKRDGRASYEEDSRGQIATWRATLDAEELRALAATLREHDLCSLTSSRRTGVPDEARPTIDVQLDGLDCRVTLWDNEWSDDEDAAACLRAVEALGQSIKARGE